MSNAKELIIRLDNYPSEENSIKPTEETEELSKRAIISNARTCPYCGSLGKKSSRSKDKPHKQRYYCKRCKKTYVSSIELSCIRVRLLSKEERQKHEQNINNKSNEVQRIKYQNLRNQAIAKLGSKCQICGRSQNINFEIHHLTYKYGNPYKDLSKEGARRATIKEVLEHPENFALLCHRDHEAITLLLSYRDKFNILLNASLAA